MENPEHARPLMLESGPFFVYSLTGYDVQGIFEEVFLIHDQKFHPNEFQSLVIHCVGKLKNEKKSERLTIHDVVDYMEQKFEFKRFSFYNCYVFDRQGHSICETSVRG